MQFSINIASHRAIMSSLSGYAEQKYKLGHVEDFIEVSKYSHCAVARNEI